MQVAKLQVIFAIILFAGTSVFAQTQPNLENGYKAYGSYDGSNIDTINVMNGNLMLHLPMPFNYPQRGGKLDLLNQLTISSKNWTVQCDPGCHWTAGGGVGSMISQLGTGLGFDYTMDLSVHRDTVRETDSQGNVFNSSIETNITTADGASHLLYPSPNSALDPNGDALSYDTADFSGYHLDLSNPDPLTGIPMPGVIIDRNGNRYAISSWFSHCDKPVTENNLPGSSSSQTCHQASRTGSITDVNGNVFTLLGGTGSADTMGRTFTTFLSTSPSATDYSGCVSNTWPLVSVESRNYPGFNYTGTSTPNQFKLCYANVSVQTAFGITINGGRTTVAEAQSVVPMLVTVVMPDGSSWKFDYDSYGNVTHLGLPLGGSIDYTWTTISPPSCGENTTVSRAVSTRTINDNNGHLWQWLYNYGVVSNSQMTNTVTDPLGNDTVHVFTALVGSCSLFYETTTRDYQGGASGGQILQQVETTYSLPIVGTMSVPFANSYKTTVYPSMKVKLVQRTPDSGTGFAAQPTLGLVAQELDYDWGQGAPGPLLRETDTVYQWQKDPRYLTAHLLDLKASVVTIDPNSANNTKSICPVDGAGTTRACAAETDYAYDEAGYLQSYEAANGPLPAGTHVAAPNSVRGNLTSVGRWLNTAGTAIVSHTNWFDTGMIYQSIDPLNHASTLSYDQFYAGTFPTKTCDALNHCVSGTYDFTTGLLTSFTNQNGTAMASGNTPGDTAHTMTYGYDSVSRMTLASFPDGGRVAFNYSAPGVLPVYSEKLKKINVTLPDDDSFTYLDGLGRPFKAVHKTPNGDALVITTYDALDHAIKITNPYLSTSDPTYGVIQTQYDASGRLTQSTKQDGSFSMAVFSQNDSVSNGDCATATDEAGNQRRSCTDALGRVVEVDEPNPNAAATAATASMNVTGAEQTGMTSSTITVPGSGFESPFMGTGSGAFQYHPAGSNWTFSSNNGLANGVFVGGAGVSGNGSAFTNLSPPAPEGVQVAFIQGGSANFFSQSLSGFQAGASYTVSFKATQRGSNSEDFDVYLDSTLLGTFRPAGSAYATFSTNAFITTTGAHTLKFAGRDSAGGDNTAFIDAVQVSGTVPISDSGTVSLTVNGGAPYVYNYGANDNTGTIINGLVNQITADGAALVTATATVNNDVAAAGSGFESPFMGTGSGAFQYHPAGSNWTFSSNNGLANGVFVGGAGVSGNGSAFTNLNPPAPEGLQVAFIQGGSANFFSQALSGFQAGVSYIVSFKAAQRGSNAEDFDVYLDSTLLGTFRPGGSNYGTLTSGGFITTAGTHTLKFVGRDSAGGDNTAFIDAVRVLALAGSTINLTSKAKGSAINSYTLTATTKSGFTNPSFTTSTSAFNGGKDADALNNNPYVTLYSYDALGDLLRVNQNGDGTAPRIRTFTYDSLSRLLTATNPESGTVTYRYDNVGNVLQKTSPAANQTGSATTTISICYDSLNRPTGKAYSAQICQNGQLPPGTAVVSYVYDVGSNTIGNVSSLTDQSGSSSYSYDALGRVTSERRTISGITRTVSYDHNLDGSVSAIHYPSGAVVTYTPDSAARIVSVTDSVNGINYVTGATYAPNNSVTGFVNGKSGTFAGISNTFSYNSRLQPVNISAVTPNQQQVFSVGYNFHVGNGTSGNDNGNVWGFTNFKDSSRSETFGYDVLNRLASAQTAGTDCNSLLPDGHTKNWGNTYSYDAWGNLLAKTSTKCGGESIALTVNTKNQPTAYPFDAAGNLTSDGISTYTYDAENRLSTVSTTGSAVTWSYTYDAGGNRVKKTNGTSGTLYWSASVGVIAETDLAGNNPKEYTFFNGMRVARRDSNGQVFYYFSDHLKTTAVITDSAGNIKSESDFDPWGSERRVVDSFNNTYKFTGKERDGESGLDYFGARYYASTLGRFTTVDPLDASARAVSPQTLNRYTYALNNPLRYTDANGEYPQDQHMIFTFWGAVVAGRADARQLAIDSGRADDFWHAAGFPKFFGLGWIFRNKLHFGQAPKTVGDGFDAHLIQDNGAPDAPHAAGMGHHIATDLAGHSVDRDPNLGGGFRAYLQALGIPKTNSIYRQMETARVLSNKLGVTLVGATINGHTFGRPAASSDEGAIGVPGSASVPEVGSVPGTYYWLNGSPPLTVGVPGQGNQKNQTNSQAPDDQNSVAPTVHRAGSS